MKICVLGLGYIGLPTAVMFAKHDTIVHGVDVNPHVVNMLQNGELHIEEPGLKERLDEVMAAGKLTVSTDVVEADTFIIAVPTPINEDKTGNLDYVRSATRMVLPYLKPGNLVILESTVPPRTVEDVMVPILAESELKVGHELFVSHSPERVLPGKLFEELVHNDRIVGGINEASSAKTVELYKRFVQGTIHVTDATKAEMAKLMENTYRDVNIALANELARIAEKIGFDIWEAIDLANCHPRVNIHKPGPGVGGHCIAVDPWFIIEQATEESQLISLARNINNQAPARVADTVEQMVQDMEQAEIAICGLAYKGDIDDMRESPSLEVIRQLKSRGYSLRIFDPFVKETIMENQVHDLQEAARGADVLLFLTDHTPFRNVDFAQLYPIMRNRIIIDTRNIYEASVVENAGFTFAKIGTNLPQPSGLRA